MKKNFLYILTKNISEHNKKNFLFERFKVKNFWGVCNFQHSKMFTLGGN